MPSEEIGAKYPLELAAQYKTAFHAVLLGVIPCSNFLYDMKFQPYDWMSTRS